MINASKVSLQWVQPTQSTHVWSNLYKKWNPTTLDQISKVLYYKLLKQYLSPKYLLTNSYGVVSIFSSIVFVTDFSANNKIEKVLYFDPKVKNSVVFDSSNQNHILLCCTIKEDSGLTLHWRDNERNDEWRIVIHHDEINNMKLEGIRTFGGIDYFITAFPSRTEL